MNKEIDDSIYSYDYRELTVTKKMLEKGDININDSSQTGQFYNMIGYSDPRKRLKNCLLALKRVGKVKEIKKGVFRKSKELYSIKKKLRDNGIKV